MPKLVAGGPGKRKFWHAWVNGAELTVRFGKLGSTGQEQSKAFPSDEAATKELAKLVKQKLAKGYGDAASHFTFDDSGLLLDEIVDLPLPTPDDASAAHRDTTMREGSWSDTFWMGDYVFALEHVRDKHYAAGIIDRTSGEPTWRRIKPNIEGFSFAAGFDPARAHMMLGPVNGALVVVDCKTLECKKVADAGDEMLSGALARDFIAVLRKSAQGKRLELYAPSGEGWKIAKTIPCGRQDTLWSFGGGLGLIVGWEKKDEAWDGKRWPHTHFLGLDGDVRLLGTNGLGIDYVFEDQGRSFLVHTSSLHEIANLDAALAKVAKHAAPKSLP